MRRLPILILLLLVTAACNRRPTYNSVEDALRHFPGYLDEQNAASLQALARQDIEADAAGSGGVVLLYSYEGARPAEEGLPCLAVTFLSQNEAGRFRAESSGQLGCDESYAAPEAPAIAYLPGGNVRELATVYGLAPGGATVRVLWADGFESSAPVADGAVLLSRPQTVLPHTVEILDEAGAVIHAETFD